MVRRQLAGCACAFALLAGGVAQATGTTLNPADKSASATLSNNNLTITTIPSTPNSARSTTSQTVGNLCFETSIDTVGSTFESVGLSNGSASLTSLPGTDANSLGWRVSDAVIRFSGSSLAVNLGTITAGSVLMECVNFSAKNVWLRGPNGNWDGNGTDNPATGVGGFNGTGFYNGGLNSLITGGLFVIITANGGSFQTTNFGATATTYTVPAGFTMWDGAAATCGAIPLLGAGPC